MLKAGAFHEYPFILTSRQCKAAGMSFRRVTLRTNSKVLQNNFLSLFASPSLSSISILKSHIEYNGTTL